MWSSKTYPVGLGILFALYATNFFEEKWVGIFAIFLILGVYAIDLVRFLMTPKQKQEDRKAPGLEIISKGVMTFNGPGDVEVLVDMAKQFGCAIVLNNYTPTNVWVVKNVPHGFAGTTVWVTGRNVSDQKVLDAVNQAILAWCVVPPPQVNSFNELTEEEKRYAEVNRLNG